MPVKGFMTYFDVEKCGLYGFKNGGAEGVDLEETFDLIKDWVQGRPFLGTIPWDPKKSRDNKAKCYCRDIVKNHENGDFLVVLWKSDTDSAGTLWGVEEGGSVGSGNVVKYTAKHKGANVVWGRPCYYWVIPRFNVVVSIKFDHSVCDAQLFEDYIVSCINNRVKHKDRKKENTEKGYVRIIHEKDGRKLAYRFYMKLKSVNTSDESLSDLAKKVTHIVKRETVRVNTEDARADWVKKFDKLPFVGVKDKGSKRRIEVKAEAKPTKEEIREIIEKNARENRKASEWDNVGFDTDTGVKWVDRYRLKDYLFMNYESEQIFSASQVYQRVQDSRMRLVAPLIRAENNRDISGV